MSKSGSSSITGFTVPRIEQWIKRGGGSSRKPLIFRDSECPGLILLVREPEPPSNFKKAAFGFEAKLNKVTIRVVMDRSLFKTLGDARKEAIRLKGLIDQGIDPRVAKATQIRQQEEELAAIKADKKAQRVQVAKACTPVRVIWDGYVDEKKSDWGDRHLRDYMYLAQLGGEEKSRGTTLTKPGALAAILDTPVGSLDKAVLKAWLETEKKTRANGARQAFEALRACWRWAVKTEEFKDLITEPGLFDDEEVSKAKPKRQAAAANDVLEKSHLVEWFTAVGGIRNKELSVFLQMLLLTGCRRNELLGLQWKHIETRAPANIWVHDKVDGDIGRYVPLGPYAQWLLAGLAKHKWTDGKGKQRDVEWVFSSSGLENAPVHHDSPGVAHRRALTKAGVRHVSLHGLRRSYTSLCEWIEMPAGITAQIQGHKASAIQERHYKRRPLELLAQWQIKFEDWILEQGNIVFYSEQIKGGLRLIK